MTKLSNIQLNKLSNISSDIGIVALASVALPAILGSFNLLDFLLGLFAALVCWMLSLWIIKS